MNTYFYLHRSYIFVITILACLLSAVGYYTYYYYLCNATIMLYHGTVITMDPQRRILTDGAVVIINDRIEAVGETAVLQKKYRARTAIDARGNIIMPGLINGHAHTAMSLFRGVADDVSLKSWLYDYIFPLEHNLVTPDFVYWGTSLGCLEMVEGGVTTVVDMYFHEGSAAQAFTDLGMRAIAGYTIFSQQDLIAAEDFIKAWQNHPLVLPAVAPHALYTCSTEVLQAAHQLAQAYQVPLTAHIAETETEVAYSQSHYHLRPVEYFNSIGLLSPRLIAAHLVHVTPHEIQLLKQHQVGVIHNPSSNMKLASGIIPLTDMIAQGLLVGLGSDGAASNNVYNIMQEMRTASLLQRVASKNPHGLSAQTIVELATIRGAQAIHQDHTIGSLEPGKRADVIVIDLHTYAHSAPLYNVFSQLVYASESSDVQTVIINGILRMHNRKLLYPSHQQVAIFKHAHSYQQTISVAVSALRTSQPSLVTPISDYQT